MSEPEVIKFDLSPVQRQFWLQYQGDPDGSAYNIASLFEVSGVLNREIVNETLQWLVDRHESLRTLFISTASGPQQQILPHVPVILREDEYSLHALKRDIEETFIIDREPLFRFILYRKGKQSILLFVFHHLVVDLRSKDIFGKEFSHIYNALKKGEIPEIADAPSYSDYVAWHEAFSLGQKYGKMSRFWDNENLDSAPLELITDFERSPVPRTVGTRLSGALPAEIYRDLHRLCGKLNTYPFLVLISAYYLLLHKYTGQSTISVGIPRTNRYEERFSDTFGCFVNILPMVIDFDGIGSFHDLLAYVRKKMLLIHRNQYVPYVDVIEKGKGIKDRKYNPLFQTGFTNEYPMDLTLDGLTVEPLPIPGHGSQLDLFLYFWERNGVFHWELEYNTELFTEKRACLFVSSYKTLLRQIIMGNDFPLHESLWLSEEWKKKVLVRWNRTDCGDTSFSSVHSLFEQQAELYPESTALVFKGETLSYGELNRRANRLAHKLIDLGAVQETVIGISLDRSFEMVIGLLGILKSGASYMPMEPTHPIEYKRNLIEETNLEILVTKKNYQGDLVMLMGEGDVIALDGEAYIKAPGRTDNPNMPLAPENRAYLFFTSGSTGKPKGVEIEHGGLTDRILWMDETFRFDRDRKTLLKTPYNFDVSGMEFWLPLTTGAPLVIAEPEGHLDNAYLADIIVEENVSVAHFVPSLLNTFLKSDFSDKCSSLRDVLCCGEALPASVVNEFYKQFPHCRLHNLYGPTEATIFITYWKCEKKCTIVPIGEPVSKTQVYVLDEKLNPLPPGVKGDLYLAGSGLARGYYRRKELTDKAFFPHLSEPGSRMYKSGDLAYWGLEGQVHFLGRSDSQVQLHGQRIELGEIEEKINSHPGIDASAVILEGEFGSEQRLVSYITRNDAGIDAEQIKAHILKNSPRYMVPSLLFFLDELPLSANGKLDREKLPKSIDLESEIGDGEKNHYRSSREERIARIWEEVLKVPVGRNDNFFDLGGTSLQLMEMQKRLSEELVRDLKVTDLFRHPSVSALCASLKDETIRGEDDSIALRANKMRSRRRTMIRAKA